ncbi:MAG: SOS response-associated peptidase [Pseudomonadota bacterium]|nr:SOS response-associated peptidase [Pseudomonadota bacterium]
MCGRAKLDSDWSEIVRVFDLSTLSLVDYRPRYNIAPTDLVPVITGLRGARQARWATWGFVPFWEKTTRPKSRPINAMAETIATNGMFKGAFSRGRCVVPATGFYEWATVPEGKQPYLFARVDRRPMALAGICSRWRPDPSSVAEAIATAESKGRVVAPWLRLLQAEGSIPTYAVLTTTPNSVTEFVHDRMPVVLPDDEAIERWLTEGADVAGLLRPAPDDLLDTRRVNPAMGSVKVDTPEGCAILD